MNTENNTIENGSEVTSNAIPAETLATVKEAKFTRTNRKQRESLQLGGVGVNAFGSFCSDGVNVALAETLNASRTLLDEQTLNGESETLFHLTESEKHGLHAGVCQRFDGVKLSDGSTRSVLMRTLADGTRVYYLAEIAKGFALVSDAELLALASEKRDLRQFRQKVRQADGTFADGEALKGALVRASLDKNFNALVYRTANGLNVRTIMTRKAKEHENEFFVETSAIKDIDALASEIFDGVKVKQEKDKVRNAGKRARAKLVKEAKAKKAK